MQAHAFVWLGISLRRIPQKMRMQVAFFLGGFRVRLQWREARHCPLLLALSSQPQSALQ